MERTREFMKTFVRAEACKYEACKWPCKGRMNAQPCQIGSITLAYGFDKYEWLPQRLYLIGLWWCESTIERKVVIGFVEDGPRALLESVVRH